MDPSTAASEESVTHIVYDPATGRILGTMRHDRDVGDAGGEDAGDAAGEAAGAGPGAHVGCACHGDRAALVGFVEERAAWRQGAADVVPQLLEAPPELPARLSELRVDVASQRLLPLPHLVIDPERTVLEGDGEDTVTVEIRAVDERGAVVEDFTGEVHVAAGRGRLSERGGTVRLEGGRATVRLTSVRETVDSVPLVVSAPDGSATAASTALVFE